MVSGGVPCHQFSRARCDSLMLVCNDFTSINGSTLVADGGSRGPVRSLLMVCLISLSDEVVVMVASGGVWC